MGGGMEEGRKKTSEFFCSIQSPVSTEKKNFLKKRKFDRLSPGMSGYGGFEHELYFINLTYLGSPDEDISKRICSFKLCDFSFDMMIEHCIVPHSHERGYCIEIICSQPVCGDRFPEMQDQYLAFIRSLHQSILSVDGKNLNLDKFLEHLKSIQGVTDVVKNEEYDSIPLLLQCRTKMDENEVRGHFSMTVQVAVRKVYGDKISYMTLDDFVCGLLNSLGAPKDYLSSLKNRSDKSLDTLKRKYVDAECLYRKPACPKEYSYINRICAVYFYVSDIVDNQVEKGQGKDIPEHMLEPFKILWFLCVSDSSMFRLTTDPCETIDDLCRYLSGIEILKVSLDEKENISNPLKYECKHHSYDEKLDPETNKSNLTWKDVFGFMSKSIRERLLFYDQLEIHLRREFSRNVNTKFNAIVNELKIKNIIAKLRNLIHNLKYDLDMSGDKAFGQHELVGYVKKGDVSIVCELRSISPIYYLDGTTDPKVEEKLKKAFRSGSFLRSLMPKEYFGIDLPPGQSIFFNKMSKGQDWYRMHGRP